MTNQFEVQRRAAVFYATRARKILSSPQTEFALDAYAWDHDGGLWLSPIERGLWHDARGLDLVLYPQWPVAGFFVDFANPVARVAIECDGKQFHDQARDRPRQKAIESKGWSVYRFPGWMCNQDSVVESVDENGRFLVEESECIRRLREIGARHNIKRSRSGVGKMISVSDVLSSWIKELA